MENSKSVILQCVRNRLRGVPTLRFDLENFGVLGEGSLMGGGRLREVVAHGGSTVFTSQKEEHLTDFQFLYCRCNLSLTLDTDARVERRGGVAGTFWCYVRSCDIRLTWMPNWLVGMTLFHVSRAGDNFCTNLQRILSQFVNEVAERAPNTRPAVIGWSMLVILRSSLCTPTLSVILDSKVIHPLKTKRKPYE